MAALQVSHPERSSSEARVILNTPIDKSVHTFVTLTCNDRLMSGLVPGLASQITLAVASDHALSSSLLVTKPHSRVYGCGVGISRKRAFRYWSRAACIRTILIMYSAPIRRAVSLEMVAMSSQCRCLDAVTARASKLFSAATRNTSSEPRGISKTMKSYNGVEGTTVLSRDIPYVFNALTAANRESKPGPRFVLGQL